MATSLLQIIGVQAQLDASQAIEEGKKLVQSNKEIAESYKATAEAQRQSGQSSEDAGRRLGVSTTELNKLERAASPAIRAQQDLARYTAALDRLLADHKINIDRYNQDLALLQRRYGDASEATDRHGRSISELAPSYRSLETGVREVIEQLSMGAGPVSAFTVAIESLSRGFHGFEFLTTGAIGTALSGIGAGLYLIFSRAEETESQLRTFNTQLNVMGTQGLASAEQMQRLFVSLRDTGSSSDEANKLVTTLGRIPGIMADQRWERIPTLARDLGKFMGIDAPSAERELVAAFQGGGTAMEELAKKYDVLRGATANTMMEMTRTGDSTKEFFVLADALIAKYGGTYQNSLTAWDQFKNAVRKGWNDMIDSLSETGWVATVRDALVGIFHNIPAQITAAQTAWNSFRDTMATIVAPGINEGDWEEVGKRAADKFWTTFVKQTANGAAATDWVAEMNKGMAGFENAAIAAAEGAAKAFVNHFLQYFEDHLPKWLKDFLFGQYQGQVGVAPGYVPEQVPSREEAVGPSMSSGQTTVGGALYRTIAPDIKAFEDITAGVKALADFALEIPQMVQDAEARLRRLSSPNQEGVTVPLPPVVTPEVYGPPVPPQTLGDRASNLLRRFSPISAAQAAEVAPTYQPIAFQAEADNTEATKQNTNSVDDLIKSLSQLPDTISNAISQQMPHLMGYIVDRFTQSSSTLLAAMGKAYTATPEQLTPGSTSTLETQKQVWNSWFGWTGQRDNPQVSGGIMSYWQNPTAAPAALPERVTTTLPRDNTDLIAAERDLITAIHDGQTAIDATRAAIGRLSEVITGMPEQLGTSIANALGPALDQMRLQLAAFQQQGQPGQQVGSTPYPGAQGLSAITIPGATAGENALLAMIRGRESYNRYDANSGRGDYGAYQFRNPTWQFVSNITGIGGEYANAAAAPPQVQDVNALALERRVGPNSTMSWAMSARPQFGGAYPTAEQLDRQLTEELDRQLGSFDKLNGVIDQNTQKRQQNNNAQVAAATSGPAYTQLLNKITDAQKDQNEILSKYGPEQAFAVGWIQKRNEIQNQQLSGAERENLLWQAGFAAMKQNNDMRERQTAINEVMTQSEQRRAAAYAQGAAIGQQQERIETTLLETIQRGTQMSGDQVRTLGSRTRAIQDATSMTQRLSEVSNLSIAQEVTTQEKRIATLTDTKKTMDDVAMAYTESIENGKKAQAGANAQLATNNILLNAEKALDAARATGNQQLIDQAQANLTAASAVTKHAEQIELDTIAARDNLQAGQQVAQQRDQLETLQAQMATVGLPTADRQRILSELQLQQQLNNSLAGPEIKNKWHDVGQAIIDVRYRTQELEREQARIDELMRGIANTINSTIGSTLNDIFSGRRITDWGARLHQMLASIATQFVQSQFAQPLLGSLLGGKVAEQYGTLGGGGGLLGNLLGIGQTAGTLNSLTSGGGGLLSGLGGLLGIGGSAPSTGALLEAGGGAAGVVGGASGATAGVVGAATGVTEAATPLAASAAASATAGGVGLLGAAGAAIPYVGAAIAAGALLSSLFKAPAPTNATGGTINLGAPGGTINLQTTGTSVNAGAAGSLLNPINQFASNLYSQTGGNVPGQIAGQAFTNKQGQAVYQLDFAGPQGTVKAQFASAQDAVNAAELAIAHNLQGVGDAMKKALSTVTDPSQIQDAINFVNVYTKVNTAFDNMFSNFEGASKTAGPYAQGLAQINSTYNDLAQNAKKYTLDQTPIVAAADAAFARLRDDFNTNIQDMTTALSSSFAGTLKAEKEAGQQRINDAIAVGGKLDEVEKYNAANLEKMAIGAANQLAQMGSQFDNVVGQLADSLRTSFSSVETQLTNVFKSVGNLDLLSGSDPFSQAFNQIRTQAEAARQAAATTYPTTAGGFQGRIDAAMKQWQDLSEQSLKFVENTGAMSNSLENGAVAALNYATALKESADQQAVLGQAVQAALTGVEEAAIARLRTDFDANIQNLTTALTDPVQAAVTQEYEAGQNRIAIAKQVGGDLAAVEQYNEKNLQRVAQQAVTATNDISKAIEAAVGKIGSLATTGNLGTIGTFGQAIQQAVSPTAATTGVFTKAVADLNDALGQAVQTITQLTQGTPDFTALLKGYAGSLDTLRSSFNQQIQDLLLAMTDPVQAAINAELKAGQQRVADAQNIGADLAAVDEYNTQNLEKVGQAALQSAGNVADLTSQLQTFNQSLQQLLSGPLSGLTPAQQVTTSQAKFEDVLGAVKGGDLTRLGELGTAGTETVQAAVTAYGNSGKTAEIRSKIVSDLQEVSKSSDVVTAQSKADANSATATSKDLSDKYATQVAAADDYANQLQAASDDYKSKHGEVNQALQNEADSAKATAAEFHKVLVANTGITRAVVDSATVRLGALQQEVDAARRSATTAQASADVADKALAIQQDILDKQTKTLQSLLDSQIAVAQNIIDAQQKMADAFSASVDRFVSALSTATQAAQAAQGPSASPWGNADWGNYRITGDVGWSGTVILDPAQAELWKSRQYVINPIKAEVPGHPGYGTYDVYLNMPISTDVWGTGEFAKYWQSSGLRVSPNFQAGGIMAHPGWALVGEAGPEYVKLPGGAQVLPHGVMPPAGGSNESSLSEPMLHALQEMHATMQALLKQTQGGHRQSTSDAKAIVGEVSELRREVAFGGATMRRAV